MLLTCNITNCNDGFVKQNKLFKGKNFAIKQFWLQNKCLLTICTPPPPSVPTPKRIRTARKCFSLNLELFKTLSTKLYQHDNPLHCMACFEFFLSVFVLTLRSLVFYIHNKLCKVLQPSIIRLNQACPTFKIDR